MFLFLVSCRNVTKSQDPSLRLRERVDGFISARQKANLGDLQAYYLNPEKARIAHFNYIDSKIKALSIGKNFENAQVELSNTIKVMGFTFNNLPQTLHWEWHNDDWYYIISDNHFNPFTQPEK